jgi:peptide/nickel transport system substrate-binding protein
MTEKFTTLDTLTTTSSDASSERIRNLIFNSLVRKDANFDYVGELASDFKTSEDGKIVTFTLRDGVKFHNGKVLTSADVKYTLDQLFAVNGYKAGAFFDTVPDAAAGKTAAPATPAAKPDSNANTAANPAADVKTKRIPHITSVETPDAKTVVIGISRPSLLSTLLSNLVAVPIIPEGTVAQQKDSPLGSGPFKFVSYDASQGVVDFAANPDYWDGAPKVPKLTVRVLSEASALQAELQAGHVDLAPNPSGLQPDVIKQLGAGGLKVDQFDGSNIQYLIFNTQSAPLDNLKVRQAIGYAIDKQKIVKELLADQARVATAVLPPESWAYSEGKVYNYDPAKAKQLLQESGYKGEPIVFKFRANSASTSQYSQAIQNSLSEVGLTIQIETLDGPTSLKQLAQGQFQMYTGIWVGGNTDPIFMKNLFASSMIPNAYVPCCNRSRYTNPELDKTVDAAIEARDKAEAKQLYAKSWALVSNDLPMLPLWYPANIVISSKRIGNIKMSGSGEWTFLKDVTVGN